MDELKARILSEGKVLPGNIIKVGSFLNHRIDTALRGRMADEFAKHFDISKITMILTIEASGIALASVCSYKWGIPMLFPKKAKSKPLTCHSNAVPSAAVVTGFVVSDSRAYSCN